MAKKRSALSPAPPPPARPTLTAERFRRLHELVQFLGVGPKTRAQILARLGLDVRGFYRDLELLRAVGIEVTAEQGRYALSEAPAGVLARLPFPDPHLTLGEARQLARGRGKPNRRLQEEIARILG
jgi:predicted DNA-binding transcriptional regulator YafY